MRPSCFLVQQYSSLCTVTVQLQPKYWAQLRVLVRRRPDGGDLPALISLRHLNGVGECQLIKSPRNQSRTCTLELFNVVSELQLVSIDVTFVASLANCNDHIRLPAAYRACVVT